MFNWIRRLFLRKEVKEAYEEIKKLGIETVAELAVVSVGGKQAIGFVAGMKALQIMGKGVKSAWDQRNVRKIERFISGAIPTEKEKERLRRFLAEHGNDKENTYRLVDCIFRAETMNKVKYLIEATKCANDGYIDLTEYFRICLAIVNNLEEDLIYLQERIVEEELHYDQHVQALWTTGLVYQIEQRIQGRPKYAFTTIAKMVDQFALSHDKVERYPNPAKRMWRDEEPITRMPDAVTVVLEGATECESI